jgi:hypothetical protein
MEALNVTLLLYKRLIIRILIIANPVRYNRVQIVLLSFYTLLSVLVWYFAFKKKNVTQIRIGGKFRLCEVSV